MCEVTDCDMYLGTEEVTVRLIFTRFELKTSSSLTLS